MLQEIKTGPLSIEIRVCFGCYSLLIQELKKPCLVFYWRLKGHSY